MKLLSSDKMYPNTIKKISFFKFEKFSHPHFTIVNTVFVWKQNYSVAVQNARCTLNFYIKKRDYNNEDYNVCLYMAGVEFADAHILQQLRTITHHSKNLMHFHAMICPIKLTVIYFISRIFHGFLPDLTFLWESVRSYLCFHSK